MWMEEDALAGEGACACGCESANHSAGSTYTALGSDGCVCCMRLWRIVRKWRGEGGREKAREGEREIESKGECV